MSGLDPEQLDELVWRIEEQLEEPWHKGIGRPKDLSLREAVVVASGYMRQNIIQEVWAEIFDTSQPVISGIIAKFTPLIEESTEEDRPTAEEAEEAVAREQTVLVDGFLAPTWSWRDTPELWSGKHKTTGFNGQAISNLRGDLLFVSEPITGHNHDMTALAETETADIIAAAFSGIGDKGYQGSSGRQPGSRLPRTRRRYRRMRTAPGQVKAGPGQTVATARRTWTRPSSTSPVTRGSTAKRRYHQYSLTFHPVHPDHRAGHRLQPRSPSTSGAIAHSSA